MMWDDVSLIWTNAKCSFHFQMKMCVWMILWIWLEFWMNNFFGFGFGPPQNDRLTDTFEFTSNKFKHTIFLWFKNKKDVWGMQLHWMWCECVFWVTQYEVDSNEVQLWVEQHSCLTTLCCATFYSTNEQHYALQQYDQQHYDDSVLITIC